ncbi:MAG: acyl-CoA dehydratase activase [Candidatus Helarchaeota archaeon]
MVAIGVDIGSNYSKCVAINNGNELIFTAIAPVGGNPQQVSKNLVKKVLQALKLKPKHVEPFVITGRNRKKFPFQNEERTEVTCIAKGIFMLDPSIRTIVDLGALTNKAIKINPHGRVMEYVINDRCASGSGMFLELVAKALELDIAELGHKAGLSSNPLSITNQCSIFAESEVIYLVNEGKNELDIAAGVCNSIGGNVYSLLKRVRMEKEISLVGGVANNRQIQQNLEQRLGMNLKMPSIDPFYVAAYGAALFANELGGKA